MLNPSDSNPLHLAISADDAQFLRGAVAFGAVAFHEGASPTPDQLRVDAGYADCLPILGGGCWRDPGSAVAKETMK